MWLGGTTTKHIKNKIVLTGNEKKSTVRKSHKTSKKDGRQRRCVVLDVSVKLQGCSGSLGCHSVGTVSYQLRIDSPLDPMTLMCGTSLPKPPGWQAILPAFIWRALTSFTFTAPIIAPFSTLNTHSAWYDAITRRCRPNSVSGYKTCALPYGCSSRAEPAKKP